MTVNLAPDPGAGPPALLKFKVALEVAGSEGRPEIQPLLPRVEDAFQVFVRELRASDLEGSAGVYRLREELLRRVNIAVYPAKVDAVLFKEIDGSVEADAVADDRRSRTSGRPRSPSRASATQARRRQRRRRRELARRRMGRALAEQGASASATDMAAEWATMIDEGVGEDSPDLAGADRILNQDEIDQLARLLAARAVGHGRRRHPGDRRFGRRLLRTPADARDHLRPDDPAAVHEPAQLLPGQRRGHARQHHVGALRRLHQLDPAAGAARGLQGRGVGQFRPRSRSSRTSPIRRSTCCSAASAAARRRASTGAPSPRSRCSSSAA